MPRALAPAADLVLRRRPMAVLAVLLAVGAVVPADLPFALLALVPLFGAAVHRPWRTGAVGVVGIVVAELVHWAAWGSRGGIAEVAASAGLAVVTVAVGSAVRERRRGAERERTLLAGQAVAEERLRIARELHDAVGHDVSLMVVQGPGGRGDDE